MISSIGGSNAALSLLARVEARKTQEAQAAGTASSAQAGANTAAAGEQAGDGASAVTRSAQSEAVDRLGGQLDAQAAAARVREAAGEAPPPPPDGMAPQGPPPDAAPADDASTAEAGASASAEDAATGETAAASGAAAGGVRMGGAPASSGESDSESDDYIAEADTNNDRKLSEQERIAYEKKLAQQSEKPAQGPQEGDALAHAREQEVRQAYLPQADESRLDITA